MPSAPTASTAASESSAARPLRLILWSLAGSARHYNGPGLMFHRMFSRVPPGRFEITLVHGYAQQEEDGVYARYVRLPGSGTRVGQLRFTMAGVRWLKRHAHEYDALLAVTAYEPSIRPAWYADTKLGLPCAIFLANEKYELFPNWKGWRRLLGSPEKRQAMVRDVSGVVAMSKNLYQEAKDIGVDPAKLAHIPNTVDTDRFAPLSADERAKRRAELGIGPGPVVVFCGELTRRKRPHLLIEALRRSFERKRPFTALLVGPPLDEEYRREMEAAAASLPEPSRVRFEGFTKTPEVQYKLGDAFCLPSTNEGMPGALVEAMASGLPAVVTAFSSAHELLGDGQKGSVVEVPPGAPESALADGIEEAIAHWTLDPERAAKARKAARDSIIARHGLAQAFDTYEAFFRRMMRDRRARAK
ncbi:MAG: glycosyltransferase family 4 protein [Phycisphaerae bacterium]|nr:glycosyltransferase family 4 protein [Phycisphaerae bacterium]